jgi:hypothetical protein
MLAKSAMYIVAIRAFNQSFFNRVVRLPVEHGFYILMACETELIFIKFQALRNRCMNLMTIIAGNVIFPMGSYIPKSQIFGFFMACQTFGCSSLRITFFVKYKIPPAPLPPSLLTCSTPAP